MTNDERNKALEEVAMAEEVIDLGDGEWQCPICFDAYIFKNCAEDCMLAYMGVCLERRP